MIVQRKRWMTYTYFNPSPGWNWSRTHLFSTTRKKMAGMVRVPFSTLTVDLRDEHFLEKWSSSTRAKIHRAQGEHLAVDRGNYLLVEILHLFNSRVRAKGLSGYAPNHFDTLFPLECSAIYVEGVMLCGHIWLVDAAEKRALLYVNASNQSGEPDDRPLVGRAHYFLLWQDGLYLRQMGIQILDLMGYEADSPDPGLRGVYQWKAGTHGQTAMLYHYYPGWFYLLRKFRNMLTG